MAWYKKWYKCPCGNEWHDQWENLCNDKCICGKEIEPHDWIELSEVTYEKTDIHRTHGSINIYIMYFNGSSCG
jgi:hypothetical protein